MSSFSKIIGKWFNSNFCSNKEKRTKTANLLKKYGFEPKLIVLMDGGICSQINQFAIGEYYRDKGYTVEYDLDFFEKNGKDLNGIFDRNYQLDKLIELKDSQIIRASHNTLKIYKKFFYNASNIEPNHILDQVNDDYCPPIYLNNYYCFDSEIFANIIKKFISLKKQEELLDEENNNLAKKILNSDSVGIHVRLGDLAKPVASYTPVSTDYYLRAINLPELKNKELYFFSEEPEWIEQNILPKLDNNIKINIVKNPSNVGYKDLFLLSLCKHQVCSQGSFGPYSFLFNNNPNKICVLPDFPTVKNFEKNLCWDIVFKNNNLIKIEP